MDADIMQKVIADLHAERADVSARLAKIDQILAGLHDLYPDLIAVAGWPSAGTARITPVRLPSLSEGPAAFIHTGNLDGILDDIFNVAAKRPGLWLSPSDVTEQALHYGWKPNDGREPAAVIRPKLRAMTDLVARQRDGRTKEYRLRAAAGLDEVSLDAVGSDFGPASSEAGPTEASENGSSSHADVLVGAFGAQQPAG